MMGRVESWREYSSALNFRDDRETELRCLAKGRGSSESGKEIDIISEEEVLKALNKMKW